ncbi:MAG: hypothetical protein Q9222_005746 [Ikaeria aurantiellina]
MLLATVASGVLFFLPTVLAGSSQNPWSFKIPYAVSKDHSTSQTEAHDHPRVGLLTSVTESIDQADGGSSNTDLASTLRSSTGREDRAFSDALQLLESMRASPSCNRLAAYTLIRSCQSVDGSTVDAEGSLEDRKSLYAAQLALCEIAEAGTKSPDNCRTFLPVSQSQTGQKASKIFNQQGLLNGMRKDRLGVCLKSLQSSPQHWTSYSNNRQNAVVMCQAARKDVDKDDLIQTQKTMIDTASGATDVLGRAVNEANEAMLQQKAFGKEVEHLRQQVKQDLKATATETQSIIGTILKSLESAVQRSSEILLSKVRNIENQADEVEEALRTSVTRTGELRSNIDRVFQQALEGNAELADATSSSASELRSSLQGIRDHEVQPLLGAFNSIHTQLRASNELVASIHTRQHEIDGRLVNLDQSFANLESTAAALSKTQNADAEAQSRLRDQVLVELQVARGLISDVTATAASLEATIHNASSEVANLMGFA